MRLVVFIVALFSVLAKLSTLSVESNHPMNINVPEDASVESMLPVPLMSGAHFTRPREDLAARQRRAREASEAAAREVAAAEAAAAREAAEAAAAAAEKEQMTHLLIRLLAERLLYIPELEMFDLPHSIDIKELPSRAVEALVRYGPYKLADNSNPYIYRDPAVHGGVPPTRTFDAIYLTSNLEPWRRIIAEATARRRT